MAATLSTLRHPCLQVTNWWDFWNYGAWDQEVAGLDDMEDAMAPKESGLERAHKLIESINDVRACVHSRRALTTALTMACINDVH